MGRRVAGALAGLLLAATLACTANQRQAEPGPASPTTAPTTRSAPADSGIPRPLALAINVRRAPLNMQVRVARRIVAGDRVTWADLGQPGGTIHVRTGRPALDAVERDEDVLAVVLASRLRPTVQAVTVGGVDPLREPAGYALTTDASGAAPKVTTLTVVGDIMLGRAVHDTAVAAGDVSAPLRPLQHRLAGADITVGNLESTLSQAGPPEQGGDSFAAPPAVLDGLDDAGLDVLTLANNHTGDFGDQALLQTVRRVRSSPIAPLGAGRDAGQAWRPVILRHDGISFGFVAFNTIGETPRATATQPGAAEVRMQPRTGPLNASDLRRLTATIATMARRVDVVVALPHWGDQYTHTPVPDQRLVGRAMVDAGADVVVGGHPHWTQGVQLRGGHPIVHSLGNFVFDMETEPTQQGVVLELAYWGDELMGLRFVPYRIGTDFAPRVVHGVAADAILDPVWASSDPPFRSP